MADCITSCLSSLPAGLSSPVLIFWCPLPGIRALSRKVPAILQRCQSLVKILLITLVYMKPKCYLKTSVSRWCRWFICSTPLTEEDLWPLTEEDLQVLGSRLGVSLPRFMHPLTLDLIRPCLFSDLTPTRVRSVPHPGRMCLSLPGSCPCPLLCWVNPLHSSFLSL